MDTSPPRHSHNTRRRSTEASAVSSGSSANSATTNAAVLPKRKAPSSSASLAFKPKKSRKSMAPSRAPVPVDDDEDETPTTKDNTTTSRRPPHPTSQLPNALPAHTAPQPPAPHFDSLVPLATAETPTIRRNRAMRNEPSLLPTANPRFDLPPVKPRPALAQEKPQHRRSSIGMRGKRLSSSPGGLATALPHRDVSPSEFYRSVDADESDPIRLRQILLWCAKIAKEDMVRDLTVANDPKVLKMYDAVIAGITNKKINTSWYHREKDSSPAEAGTIVPHPENTSNLANIEAMEKDIQELSLLLMEEQEWNRILESHPKAQDSDNDDSSSSSSSTIRDKLHPYLSETQRNVMQQIGTLASEEAHADGLDEWAQRIARDLQFE
ncbi:hypothetical protein HDU98_005331, partial [Podochytrium sp. JEL0797]